MADKRISELTELGDIASNDFIPLVDTSVNETKKVSAETLSNFVQNNIVIPPSTTNEIEQGNSSVEVIDTGTDGRVIVTTDGVEVARFTTDGKVGIGTDTPEEKLSLYDSGGCAVSVTTDTSGGGANFICQYGTNGESYFGVSTDQTYIISSDENTPLRFLTGGFNERMRITSGGELLVGTTTNPSDYKLVVSGIKYASNYDVALTTAGSDTVALNFSGDTGLYTRSAAGTVTFTASNYRAGAIKTVRVIAGGSSRTLTFPNDWVFVGAKPASIASGKTGILTVTSFGTTEADCVAAWAVQT